MGIFGRERHGAVPKCLCGGANVYGHRTAGRSCHHQLFYFRRTYGRPPSLLLGTLGNLDQVIAELIGHHAHQARPLKPPRTSNRRRPQTLLTVPYKAVWHNLRSDEAERVIKKGPAEGPLLYVCVGGVYAALSSTSLTVIGCQRPPRAVTTPRVFNSVAIPASVLTPSDLISSMVGRRSFAN